MIPEYVCHDQCAGCAFAKGSPANQNWMTMMKAQLCLMAGEPFLCHSNLDAKGEPIYGPPLLCRGFADAIQARLDHGIEEPEWRRQLASRLSDAIVEIESTPGLTLGQQMALVDRAALCPLLDSQALKAQPLGGCNGI